MKKILVIEDNPELLENITELLELDRYEVIPALNGQQGVELARHHQPDLVISDILMPELDGFDVLHFIQCCEGLQSVPVIFLSAMAERSDSKKAISLGASNYITKPFEAEDLLNAVKAAIRKAMDVPKNN